ncbi:MAG: protein translocase subunit SecD [Candidatus Peregrinibacteria bacterium]
MLNRITKGLLVIILIALLMGVVALPPSAKNYLEKFYKNSFTTWLKDQKVTLGLDLQGGTQLDYRIDLRNAEAKNNDDDPLNDVEIKDIVEGVRNTMERRVNSLGVSEPQIYTSNVAGEEHIIVELAGIKDVNEAKVVVGKTIQLEFKEPKTAPDPGELERVKASAEATLKQALNSKTNFEVLGENTKTADGKIDFRTNQKQFVSSLPARYKDVFGKMKLGTVYSKVLEDKETTLDGGELKDKNKLYVTKLLTQEQADRTTKNDKGESVTNKEDQFTFEEIVYDYNPDTWKSTGLDGSHFKSASITYDQVGRPQVSIQFDAEGALMFEGLTGRLVNQPLAIFVGGDLISRPNVNEKIAGGSAVITGNFNIKQALALANDLNTGAIDAPVILSGQYTISASIGVNALKVSLLAALIGVIALVLFMLLYYRLLGFFAVLALGIYSVIILFLINTFPIVMTLAGIAGVVLSIGMAVDANILIFERTKEELNSGKNFIAAVAAGFDRAWSSIRDSNVSSLITCAILWLFGNSIIRGFALMLSIGILVSMFTAITVTRAFLVTIINTRFSKNRFLLGAKRLETGNEVTKA